MMAAPVKKKRAKRTAWRKTSPDIATVAPMLRQAGVACDEDPTQVHAWFDHLDRPRRVEAHYPDGIRAQLHLGLKGTLSLTQSISIKVMGVRKP
ncbi:hypothetical protein [Sphingobium aromaticiconvertens]|uniref:hypothetical protein n=1 Tax=Sphingobium aromaticiconvertens TaxID=365341 RepID=UPI003019950F